MNTAKNDSADVLLSFVRALRTDIGVLYLILVGLQDQR